MLVKMEQKGVVGHRSEGRRFIYYPLISEGDVRRTMVGELTDRLFQGDVTALVSHLISHHEVDADELTRLKNLITAKLPVLGAGQEWLAIQRRIYHTFVEMGATDIRDRNGFLDAVALLLRTAFAAPGRKYDSVRVVARRS